MPIGMFRAMRIGGSEGGGDEHANRDTYRYRFRFRYRYGYVEVYV